MTVTLASTSIVSAMACASAFAQAAVGQAECRRRIDGIAAATGSAPSSVAGGSFLLQKDKVAVLDGACGGSLSIRPEPEPFTDPLSPDYPALVIRAAVAAFDIKPAEVRQAIAHCVKTAVPDPPRHSGRAGFARQRWRDSQMTGHVLMSHLNWDCTYHGLDRRAATVTIRRTE